MNWSESESTGAAGGAESGGWLGLEQSQCKHWHDGEGTDSGAAGFAASPQHRVPFFAAKQHDGCVVVISQHDLVTDAADW